MAKTMAILAGVALLFAAGAAHAVCAYEGQRYPPGTVLCIGGKVYVCESNDAWKIDRSSTCSN
jgi:hypothetical protein